MTSPWNPTREEYREILTEMPGYRLDQLWSGLYKDGLELQEISTLPSAIRKELGSKFFPGLEEVALQQSGDGQTKKWLWRLADDAHIETVLMYYPKRSTVCISSQAGCAMGCGFCATGQAGYSRHLSVGEILEQVAAATRQSLLDGRRLSNVVFMGMGEPMANLAAVIEAVNRITTDFGIGARNIVVSTVGLIPQIRKLAEQELQIGLAVSLHAANDELRNKLVPINKQHPISELKLACIDYRRATGRRVSIEWAMMAGVNDSLKDANELAEFAHSTAAHVNLIPLNPTPGWPTVGSTPEVIKRFCEEVERSGVNITVRKNRGNDIDAACGQLEANTLKIKSKDEQAATKA